MKEQNGPLAQEIASRSPRRPAHHGEQTFKPDPNKPRPNHQLLFEIAADQGGYFTAKQAHEAGFSDPLIHHHAQRGRFKPIWARHGLYRLRDFPTSQHEHLWAAWVGAGPDAVLSHESALRLHGLSDITPRLVHIWIPFERRPRLPRSIPQGVKYHVTRNWLKPEEITLVNGLRVTTPLRTLLDVTTGGTTPDQVVMAIKQALEREWIKADEFLQAAHTRGPRVAARAEKLLREATSETVQHS
jgi:predicted transcriptional regulator of viral defense system